MIKLFVGLGNPGPDYEATRHNAGFWWIDALARELKATLVPERGYHGLVARTSVHGQSVWLLQPQTFMNLSGKSVAALARFFKIQPDEILVVHDELDVTCMPSDLPEFIAVDLSKLEKGASLHLKDIKLPKGVAPKVRGGQSNNPVLVSVVPPVEVVEAPAAEAAPAADAKGKGKGKK